MSSGITFGDYKQAREYQETLLREGMNSNISKQGGAYVVVPKEKTNITKMGIKGKEELGEHVAGEHWGWESGHEVYFRPKSSTRVKLHEVGHAIADHKSVGGIRSGDIIERELDAEIFAYKQQGRKIDYMVGADVLRQCGNQKIWGGDIRSAINEVARRMERRGIQVTRENKRALVDMIYAKTEDPEIEEWKRKLKEEI